MKEQNKDLVSSLDFMEFVSREFDKTVQHATIEDLASFAFGSIEEAIESFKMEKLNNEAV
ncbi:MAG: hypothetical protein JXA92_12560 [candidate division Zixibacteria bacterium]|nr:hypothetical protein [candidate division Zixibacteria bacterium]